MNVARVLLLALFLWTTPLPASAQEADGKVGVPEDLFAVITLKGKPCGKVTSHEKLGENDYLVTCQTGHRYRVYVSPEERVVVEER